MASPRQKFCPEWSPAKGEEVVLDQKRGRDKILLGPWSSPHGNTCPPFHLGPLLLTSPIQNPQAPEAISHLNNHSIPATLQLRWLWIRKTVSFPPPHYWNSPFSILKSFHVKDRFWIFSPLLFRHKSFWNFFVPLALSQTLPLLKLCEVQRRLEGPSSELQLRPRNH